MCANVACLTSLSHQLLFIFSTSFMFLLMTIASVISAFIFNPNTKLLPCTSVTISCSFSFDLATGAASSEVGYIFATNIVVCEIGSVPVVFN